MCHAVFPALHGDGRCHNARATRLWWLGADFYNIIVKCLSREDKHTCEGVYRSSTKVQQPCASVLGIAWRLVKRPAYALRPAAGYDPERGGPRRVQCSPSPALSQGRERALEEERICRIHSDTGTTSWYCACCYLNLQSTSIYNFIPATIGEFYSSLKRPFYCNQRLNIIEYAR